jgi:hypothetical protein
VIFVRLVTITTKRCQLYHPHYTKHTLYISHTRTPTHTTKRTMSYASTGRTPSKRVRISNDTPAVYNYTLIAGSVATLLPTMRELAQHYLTKFMKTCKKIFDKQAIIDKLANPDYIPRSAKTSFQLGASETVKLSTNYHDLVDSVEQVKTAYERQQKRNILQAAKLELEILQDQRDQVYIEGIHKITTMIYLWKLNTDTIDERHIHSIIKEMIDTDNSHIFHVCNMDFHNFTQKYIAKYPLAEQVMDNNTTMTDDDNFTMNTNIHNTLDQYFPRTQDSTLIENRTTTTAATTTVATTNTTQSPNNTTNTTDDVNDDDIPNDIEVITPTHPLRQDDIYLLNRVAKDIFVTSWTTEKKKLEDKALEIKMTKYVKLALLTKATDEAAAIVANEPTADMPQLSELINKEVAKQTGQLQKELQKAVQQIQRLQTTKNINRGEKPTRANTNKLQTRGRTNNTKSPAKSPKSKSRKYFPRNKDLQKNHTPNRKSTRRSNTPVKQRTTPAKSPRKQQRKRKADVAAPETSKKYDTNGRNNNNGSSTKKKKNTVTRRHQQQK